MAVLGDPSPEATQAHASAAKEPGMQAPATPAAAAAPAATAETQTRSMSQAPSSLKKNRPANRGTGGWPRAAWFIHGFGRFSVEDMSEAPVKEPYITLNQFFKQVMTYHLFQAHIKVQLALACIDPMPT